MMPMTIDVTVTLMSGKTAKLTAGMDTSVEELKLQAQMLLQVGSGVLRTASGECLMGNATVSHLGLQAGEVLTLQIRPVQIAATSSAFATCRGDGSAVSWSGSYPDTFRRLCQGVSHIQASQGAFAAILETGSVFTWGDPAYGGDSSSVQNQLRHVREIQASQATFAAILEDGSVVTWGPSHRGGP